MLWRIVLDFRPGVQVGPFTGSDTETPSPFLCEADMEKFEDAIHNLKQKCCNKLTTISNCYQLKIHKTKDDDFEEIAKKYPKSGTQSVLDKLTLIKDQWRTLDFWELVQSVNPRPILEFVQKPLDPRDKIPSVKQTDKTAFERSIVLCCIFEDMARDLGWKVGDTLDIENDVFDTVGKLMMQMPEKERTGALDCMQSAMLNIQAHRNIRDDDKIRSLLITKKKYNGLNLACILLEQMIIDNKDSNVSWMRTICNQFNELFVQLVIFPEYQENIRRILNYLMKLESIWSVADIYNLIRKELLIFHNRLAYFTRDLIENQDLSIHVCLINKSFVCLKQMLTCPDMKKLICFDKEMHENNNKSLEQVLMELRDDEVEQEEKVSIKRIIDIAKIITEKYKGTKYDPGIEVDRIRKSDQKDSIDVLSSCLAVTSMALYTCREFWPLNTQIVSYCLLVSRKMKNKGRLLEILTGEGKSCITAMVAATHALLGRTVDIVTSSPVLSQRDADEFRTFYNVLTLSAFCNVREIKEGESGGYNCPIVYGTVETFARDILKTEFLSHDIRNGRTCDIVIVDEVDSMLIDQGVQCTYLSHDLDSSGMSHFEPILALISMHVSRLVTIQGKGGIVYHGTEPEVFLLTLSRLGNGIDPLQILQLAENTWDMSRIKKGFNDYLSADFEYLKLFLRALSYSEIERIVQFALNYLNLDIDICHQRGKPPERTSLFVFDNGLSSVVFSENLMKDRIEKMVIDALSTESDTTIVLPVHLREYCIGRLGHWINNAFVAKQMKFGREYIIEDNAIYPVDYKSTGVIEINKRWGDGLQQFLEIKHGLPQSPLSLVTNFLSNIDYFERYGSDILGVSGTLGNDEERKFIDDTFSVEFATIPTTKQRKLFELDGRIFEGNEWWRKVVSTQIESTIKNERAVLIICEDIATANAIYACIKKRNTIAKVIPNSTSINTIDLYTESSNNNKEYGKKVMKPRDVVITTNLGARGIGFCN